MTPDATTSRLFNSPSVEPGLSRKLQSNPNADFVQPELWRRGRYRCVETHSGHTAFSVADPTCVHRVAKTHNSFCGTHVGALREMLSDTARRAWVLPPFLRLGPERTLSGGGPNCGKQPRWLLEKRSPRRQTRRAEVMVRWLPSWVWIGSRLTVTGKCRDTALNAAC